MVRNPDKDKDIIISRLKQQGCRITKQRLMLLDVILEEDCSSCKEIYYKAVKKDPKIGAATVCKWSKIIESGLEACGYIKNQKITSVVDRKKAVSVNK